MAATRAMNYPKIYKPRQLILLGLLANPHDRRTLSDKAKAVGVSRRTTFNWRKLPGWSEAELLLWQWHVQRDRERDTRLGLQDLKRMIMA